MYAVSQLRKRGHHHVSQASTGNVLFVNDLVSGMEPGLVFLDGVCNDVLVGTRGRDDVMIRHHHLLCGWCIVVL